MKLIHISDIYDGNNTDELKNENSQKQKKLIKEIANTNKVSKTNQKSLIGIKSDENFSNSFKKNPQIQISSEKIKIEKETEFFTKEIKKIKKDQAKKWNEMIQQIGSFKGKSQNNNEIQNFLNILQKQFSLNKKSMLDTDNTIVDEGENSFLFIDNKKSYQIIKIFKFSFLIFSPKFFL